MSRKVKVVNINQAPAAKPLGVNPMDPWQAKSGIAEASEEELLHRFLNSRGINPKFVSKETKISHSKSGEFLKWKNDHEFTEEVVKENHVAIAMGNMLDDEGSMVLGQLEQMERAINMVRSHIGKDYEKQLPSWVQAKVTLATDYIDTVGNYITSKNEKVNESVKKPKPSALDRFRKASDEREKKHAETEKNSGGMTSAIDRLQKHLNKEESGISKAKETSFHKNLDTLVHKTFGKRKDELKMKEEVVTEMDKTQTPPGRDGNSVYDPEAHAGKKAYTGKPVTSVKVKKDLLKLLNKNFNKEEVELDEVYGPTQLDHDTVKKHLKNIMAIDSDEPTATSAAHAAIKKVSTIGKTSTKSTTRQMLGALIRKHKIPIDHHHRALLNKEAVELDEVLGKDASAGDWIHDFIHSDNPKFAGKSKKERQKMALGAYYGKQNENTLDSLAATQAPCDGANGGETTSIKSQRSKSARMI